MKINFKEFRFLLFFLPIFFLKLLNITAESKLLMAVSFVCFVMTVIGFLRQNINKRVFSVLMILVVYSAILVITCGKQGVFFSVVMILALYSIEDKEKILKSSFWIGVLGVIVSCYIERNGDVHIRYIGGEWTTIFKRSNILYISYTAVVCLRLFLHNKKNVGILELLFMSVFAFGMFKYTGSRTGFVSMIILVLLLYVFRFKLISNNKIFKVACIISPLIGLILSYITAFFYGGNAMIDILDNMLQGRIRQGNMYINRYDLALFGQKIYESSDVNDFWNLDCAYLDMLICYGTIFTVLWIVVSCLVIKYLYENGRFIEVSILVMYAIYGISETFLPNCFLNVSLFLYAEYLYYLLDRRRKKYNENKNNSNVSASVS